MGDNNKMRRQRRHLRPDTKDDSRAPPNDGHVTCKHCHVGRLLHSKEADKRAHHSPSKGRPHSRPRGVRLLVLAFAVAVLAACPIMRDILTIPPLTKSELTTKGLLHWGVYVGDVNQTSASSVANELEIAHDRLHTCDRSNQEAILLVARAQTMVNTCRQQINVMGGVVKTSETTLGDNPAPVQQARPGSNSCLTAIKYEKVITKMRQKRMELERALSDATARLRRTTYEYEQLKKLDGRDPDVVARRRRDESSQASTTHTKTAATHAEKQHKQQAKPGAPVLQGSDALSDRPSGGSGGLKEPVQNSAANAQHGFASVRPGAANILTIGIPTIARRRQADYLRSTLHSIYAQLTTTGLWPLVRVVVMHSHPGKRHEVFDDCQQEFTNNPDPAARSFRFVENTRGSAQDVDPVVLSTRRRSASGGDVPDRRVRRQTRDIVSLLRHVVEVETDTKWYLFMEDDFVLCPNALLASWHYLHRASVTVGDFSALRSSFGMNGIFMSATDLPAFAAYLSASQARRPPDHLAVEWYAKETESARRALKDRVLVSTKYNLFLHIGAISTLRHKRARTALPKCWETLKPPAVFAVEAFREEECPGQELWPCPPAETPTASLVPQDQHPCTHESSDGALVCDTQNHSGVKFVTSAAEGAGAGARESSIHFFSGGGEQAQEERMRASNTLAAL